MTSTLRSFFIGAVVLAAALFGSVAEAKAQCCCRPSGAGSQNALLIQQQQYALQQYAAQQLALQQRAAALSAQQRLQNAYNAIDRQQRLLYQQQNQQLRNGQSQTTK